MFLEIEHRLTLSYTAYIRESFLELRMQPKTTADQTLHAFALAVGPPAAVFRYRDWQGNAVHHFTVADYHDRVEVVARSLVATSPAARWIVAPGDGPPFDDLGYAMLDFLELGGPVVAGSRLEGFDATVGVPATASAGEQVLSLGRHIRTHLRYQKDVTRYDSTTEDFLALGAGVCQDFTHLMLGCLRLRRIPCRYVSGYLHVAPQNGEAAQSHAWVEFYTPGAGWIPFDPTHNRAIDERYVVVGHGRHYDDVPPNRGIYRGNAAEQLHAQVETRLSAPKDVSVLHEEVEQIDVPVYRDVPERRRERAPGAVVRAAEDAAAVGAAGDAEAQQQQ